MAQISVSNLSFSYDGSVDTVFENTSFCIDTTWKLGFVGRNGKVKTTFLNLLLGRYSYYGEIKTPVTFDYFPYSLSSKQKQACAQEWMQQIKPNSEFWRASCELMKMNADSELLLQPLRKIYCKGCGRVFYTNIETKKYCLYSLCGNRGYQRELKWRQKYARKERICQTCGNAFTPKRSDAKFCCNACRQKAYRGSVTDKASGRNDHLA